MAKAQLGLVKAELALAEARMPDDIRIAEAQVASKQAKLAEANARLAYATIRASISGTVASVATQEGETVAAGLNAPTFVTIIDLARLQVDAFVDEVDIGKVKVAQKANFTVDAFPAREFEGKVSAIYPKAIIQDNVVNYDVVIDIAGDYEELLRPEMTTNVTIFLDARRGVPAIPAQALRREQGRSVVYVLTDSRPRRREVKVGWRDGQWVEVVDGLVEGQTVLLGPPPAPAGQPEERP
jgi:RND family efflux transporter MFP subunit